MNLRRKRKAWKKMMSLVVGEPSGFGRLTPRERLAAIEYFKRVMRRSCIEIRNGVQAWLELADSISKDTDVVEYMDRGGEL